MAYMEGKVDSNKTSCRSNKDNHNKTIAMLKSKQVAHINCAKTDNVLQRLFTSWDRLEIRLLR